MRLTEIETTENTIDYQRGFVVLQLLKNNLYISAAYPLDTFDVDLEKFSPLRNLEPTTDVYYACDEDLRWYTARCQI